VNDYKLDFLKILTDLTKTQCCIRKYLCFIYLLIQNLGEDNLEGHSYSCLLQVFLELFSLLLFLSGFVHALSNLKFTSSTYSSSLTGSACFGGDFASSFFSYLGGSTFLGSSFLFLSSFLGLSYFLAVLGSSFFGSSFLGYYFFTPLGSSFLGYYFLAFLGSSFLGYGDFLGSSFLGDYFLGYYFLGYYFFAGAGAGAGGACLGGISVLFIIIY